MLKEPQRKDFSAASKEIYQSLTQRTQAFALRDSRDFYNYYFHNRRVEVLRQMLRHERFSHPLEVGSSTGMLRQLGIKDSVCLDVKRLDYVTIRASAENLPFRDGAFDFVFAGEILEHLDQPGKAIRDWVRVLESRRTMVLSTPNGVLVSPIGGNPEHKAIYTPSVVITALQKLGLRVVWSKGIFTGLISGKRLFRLIPFSWAKTWLFRFPVPLRLSYDFFVMAKKTV